MTVAAPTVKQETKAETKIETKAETKAETIVEAKQRPNRKVLVQRRRQALLRVPKALP